MTLNWSKQDDHNKTEHLPVLWYSMFFISLLSIGFVYSYSFDFKIPYSNSYCSTLVLLNSFTFSYSSLLIFYYWINSINLVFLKTLGSMWAIASFAECKVAISCMTILVSIQELAIIFWFYVNTNVKFIGYNITACNRHQNITPPVKCILKGLSDLAQN